MNQSAVDRIVAAVLYEGYLLYPYRPCVKNRQRWNFGGLYPEAYCRDPKSADRCSNQTECLVRGTLDTAIDVTVRFLHVTERVGEPTATQAASSLLWQEAQERTVRLPTLRIGDITSRAHKMAYACPARRWREPALGTEHTTGDLFVRRQEAIDGAIDVQAAIAGQGAFRLCVQVHNTVALEHADELSRDEVLMRSLVSTHTILGVREGSFVSLLDPPPEWRDAAAACRNIGTWPVLVGGEGASDTMLSSPIILYDYPRTAPESPGDLFDSTEIDEILTLRIMTLTEDEKRQAAAGDKRARELLARTETAAREQLARLHGTFRPANG